jgi:hypothetical protein
LAAAQVHLLRLVLLAVLVVADMGIQTERTLVAQEQTVKAMLVEEVIQTIHLLLILAVVVELVQLVVMQAFLKVAMAV